MRHLFLFFLVMTSLVQAFSQKTPAAQGILSPKQVAALLPDSVRQSFDIRFPIFRVYTYTDKTGQYYCVLTQSRDSITTEDTLHFKIRAVNLRANITSMEKVWELNDNILRKQEETSIWFWTKYMDFRKYGPDSLVIPVIIYGTSALNGLDDGRIKFLIYYKGQKIALRHQNGDLDSQRNTQVDNAFYDLPLALQTAIQQKMELMQKDNNAIFPRGWQKAMKDKKTSFNEIR